MPSLASTSRLSLLLSMIGLGACADDPLRLVEGALRITVIHASEQATSVVATLHQQSPLPEERVPVVQPRTVFLLEDLSTGRWDVRVHTEASDGTTLQAVWVSPVLIEDGQTSEIEVDLAQSTPPPIEICDGLDNDGDMMIDEVGGLALCSECRGGFEQAAADDDRCGTIDCDPFDRFELRGDNTVSATAKSCVAIDFGDVTTGRCAGVGACITASETTCTPAERTLIEGGICQTIEDCAGGQPRLVTAADGVTCATDKVCRTGQCVTPETPPPPPPPGVGCSDGQREGFLSLTDHPNIAACSGGFSVPGVTLPSLAATCGRVSGDDSSNPEGGGCSAADLCQSGWHVCRGAPEVSALSSSGCNGAVPPGTPDRTLFFAVSQPSLMSSACVAGNGDNDVFGCGNLGNGLPADRNCAPLDRVLASTQANRCGFNEAEPPLGPWECRGGSDSHFHEGALVTKSGCAGASCSFDGRAVGVADKGGVLCCRDGLF